MHPLQPPGAGGQLADRQRRRVVDVERAGLKRLGGLDVAAELGLGQIALADLFGGHLRGLREDPRGKLLGSAQRRVRAPHPRLLHHGSLVLRRPAATPFVAAVEDEGAASDEQVADLRSALAAELAVDARFGLGRNGLDEDWFAGLGFTWRSAGP